MFESVAVFRQAVREYGIKNERTIEFTRNKKDRARVKESVHGRSMLHSLK